MEERLKKIRGHFIDCVCAATQGRSGMYDCVVMLSGGKDSTMALYELAKIPDLKILGVTIDNGFEFPGAIENIRRAVKALRVDWILDTPARLSDILRAVIVEKVPASLCRFCANYIVNRGIKIAASFGVPVIVTGWNKGQSDREPSRHPLWRVAPKTLQKLFRRYPYMKDSGLFEGENEQLVSRYNIKIVSPWIYQTRNPGQCMKIIKKELGWKPTPESYPKNSTSCKLNLLQVILSRKLFGYTHYDCEESMLISYGEKSRRQAIQTLDYKIQPRDVKDVLKKLSLTLKEVGVTLSDIQKYSHF